MSTPNEPQSSGDGFFTRKIGPLPMWGWTAIVAGVILMYALYKRNQASTPANASAGGVNSPGGVDSSLVPQFINQSYIQQTPPAAPNVTVNNTIPAPSTTPPDIDIPPPPSHTPPSPKPPAPRPVSPQIPIFNGTYVVKKGQTLQQVANQFGISRVDLAHANGLGTGAGLRTGQVLHVPNPAPGGKPNPAQ